MILLRQETAAPERLRVYDPSGNPMTLDKSQEIARGGEGKIYTFAHNPAFLIKVLKPEVQQAKAPDFQKRLNVMLALSECRNAPFLAWPQMAVFDARQRTIGFVMRRCEGRKLRALYAPCQVQRFFPGWDRLAVTQTALNLVESVQMLARHKVLVNDFNPDNFLVDNYGRVCLIDCDSFQIPHENGAFLTSVYTPEFAAPELLFQPERFKHERTPEQVRFSLAIVVYMILMSGLHPFARCGGGTPAENLKSGKCPLDKTSGVRFPVSWGKSVSWLPESLQDLFSRMFVAGYKNPAKRPLISEFKRELIKFIEIMQKSNNPNQRAILPVSTRRKRK